jgi:hypothetical protein
MKIQLFILVVALSGLFNVLNAQDTSSVKHMVNSYHENPVWIGMMNNPETNYYEAQKAFYSYWEGRELPAESEGEANDLGKKEEEGLHLKDPTSYAMIYEYKRFKNWEKVNAHRINPTTGRILTNEEQTKIWQDQTQGVNTHLE